MRAYFQAILIVLPIVYIAMAAAHFIRRSKGIDNESYDERQLLRRDKAFKLALLSLVPGVAVCELLEAMEIVWCERGMDIFIAMMLSFVVFIVYCIYTDAWFGVAQHPGIYFASLGALSAVWLGPEIYGLAVGKIAPAELLTVGHMGFVTGAAALIVIINGVVKFIIDRRRDAGE